MLSVTQNSILKTEQINKSKYKLLLLSLLLCLVQIIFIYVNDIVNPIIQHLFALLAFCDKWLTWTQADNYKYAHKTIMQTKILKSNIFFLNSNILTFDIIKVPQHECFTTEFSKQRVPLKKNLENEVCKKNISKYLLKIHWTKLIEPAFYHCFL